MIRNFLFFVMLGTVHIVKAQNYSAIQGSSYAGSLGIHNNPASALMNPFKWDIALFGIQAKSSTNLYTIRNYSLLSNPANSQYQVNSGEKKRFASLSFNLNLLNARIALNLQSAITFGANIKSVSNLSTSSYNFIDTLKSTGDFFRINNPGNTYSGKTISGSWAEIYAGYSRTLVDDDARRVNAGIVIKVNKGLSGARAELTGGGFQRTADNRFTINGGRLDYRYSANYDHWNKNNTTTSNIRNFLQNTSGGLSFDVGIEYIVKPGIVKVFGDGDDYYDYEWKIGLSLLDAGFTQYRYGSGSRQISSVKPGVDNLKLDDKFDSTITSLAILNDTIATLVDNFTVIAGGFKVINPVRVVLNIDRFLGKDFYLNAEISINAPGSFLKKWYSVHEINLLTVTPRWETGKLGIYMPIQVTNTGRWWIGGAFKAGPLLFGVHNWANLFAKNTIQNGGGYMAIIVRNLRPVSRKYDRRLNCPVL